MGRDGAICPVFRGSGQSVWPIPELNTFIPGSRSDTDTDLPGRRLTRAAPNPYSMGTDRREKFLETRGRWEMERMQS